MNVVLTFILGAIGGFFLHSVTMKVSFKQRTIENKIKVFDSIITHWVKMRNFIYSVPKVNPEVRGQLDKMYGDAQALIGEAILICEDTNLTDNINDLNEKIYWTKWGELDRETMGREMSHIKNLGMQIVNRMREDIKNSTRLNWSDFIHILGGLCKKDMEKRSTDRSGEA